MGTDTALVRSERAGMPSLPGSGRVYQIGFSADDVQGGSGDGSGALVATALQRSFRPLLLRDARQAQPLLNQSQSRRVAEAQEILVGGHRRIGQQRQ